MTDDDDLIRADGLNAARFPEFKARLVALKRDDPQFYGFIRLVVAEEIAGFIDDMDVDVIAHHVAHRVHVRFINPGDATGSDADWMEQ